MTDTAKAIDALYSIPPGLPRDDWVRAGMAAQAAGLDFDTFDQWSAGADNYNAAAVRDTWHSFKQGKGIGAATLYHMAAVHGRYGSSSHLMPQPMPQRRNLGKLPPRKPGPWVSPAEVWARTEPATTAHPYLVAKLAQGAPLENLRVVPDGDTLRIAGENMAGALVLPAFGAGGEPRRPPKFPQ